MLERQLEIGEKRAAEQNRIASVREDQGDVGETTGDWREESCRTKQNCFSQRRSRRCWRDNWRLERRELQNKTELLQSEKIKEMLERQLEIGEKRAAEQNRIA